MAIDPLIVFLADPRIGAIGVLAAWLFYSRMDCQRERTERVALQEKLYELQDRLLKGVNEGTSSIKAMSEAQQSQALVTASMKDLLVALSARFKQ